MLPDQYYDYLLALYTEGNQPKELRKEKIGLMVYLLNLIFLLLIPISVFLIYFTELSIILQIAFLSLFVFAGIFAVFYFSKKGISYHLPIISAALILLIRSGAFVSGEYRVNHSMLYLTLVLNCLFFAGGRLEAKPSLFLDIRYIWFVTLIYFYIHIIKYFKKFLNVEKTYTSLI